ncbi:hypothetical protein GGX14DRAFT_469413 [Mycena pura]|uniref:Uncharacterized protein n=1 Tax=Mycena pura TaxID=153505 RepID=A0AAD6UZ47_9AGAR|nr:hypothetical protein GGX14DRAFT_469413 [Mycena pura]
MNGHPNMSRRSPASVDELSSLGGLDNLNFGPTTTLPPTTATSDAPRESRNVEDDGAFDVDMHQTLYPREVLRLADEATNNTDRLHAYFSVTAKMLHETAMEMHANVCTAVRSCLGAIPGIASPAMEYEPPKGSSWRVRRRALEESLLRNLRKYIRFSDHIVRKPPRRSDEKYQGELNKLYAFADKFFDLTSKLAVSGIFWLRVVCPPGFGADWLAIPYQRMKLDRLEKRQLRATIKADRAARKLEREKIRQQRDGRPP